MRKVLFSLLLTKKIVPLIPTARDDIPDYPEPPPAPKNQVPKAKVGDKPASPPRREATNEFERPSSYNGRIMYGAEGYPPPSPVPGDV